MINRAQTIINLQSATDLLTEDLIIILGPTASGKTKLAVELAKLIDAEIISVDSRQVYRGMDIGTGKDLADYDGINYHLIDIIDAGEKYNISRFLADFEVAYQDIISRGKKVIACGGTGFYLEALLATKPYTQVPKDELLRESLKDLDKDSLCVTLDRYAIPPTFVIDRSSNKRIIRAIEILNYLKAHPLDTLKVYPTYTAIVVGINPSKEDRRTQISDRLFQRLSAGLMEEVRSLVAKGVSYESLEYYGLEYKYISYYLQGQMTYDAFTTKLETEIHRYAKRQMTYFRKMEKDGIFIHWL